MSVVEAIPGTAMALFTFGSLLIVFSAIAYSEELLPVGRRWTLGVGLVLVGVAMVAFIPTFWM